MTKLNWEKANKAEKPKEKRRISNRTKVLAAYANGTERERERIIKLIQENMSGRDSWLSVIQLIKGEGK
jgi:acyl-CoA reductase-like NAD-dependent aldehyde dehydrogenase